MIYFWLAKCLYNSEHVVWWSMLHTSLEVVVWLLDVNITICVRRQRMFIPNLQRIGKGNGQMGLVYIRHGMHTSSPVPFSATSFVLCVTICTCVLYATRKMCNMPHTDFGVVLSAASRSPIFHFENERVFTNSIQNLISIQIALPQLHFHFQFSILCFSIHRPYTPIEHAYSIGKTKSKTSNKTYCQSDWRNCRMSQSVRFIFFPFSKNLSCRSELISFLFSNNLSELQNET